MRPVLFIHGYGSEREDASQEGIQQIYGGLPERVRQCPGVGEVHSLNLSRWISRDDAVSLDDVGFAMQRELEANFPDLLSRETGFHIITHSTGALVVRNWLMRFSPRPSPMRHLIHLAGAHYGSGLAHIGAGQMARWGRKILDGRDAGLAVLRELEFGASETIDMHLFFQEGHDLYKAYHVREFCICGSQIPGRSFQLAPIRYVKEDASDCTVRTSAANANLRYFKVSPLEGAGRITTDELLTIVDTAENQQDIPLDEVHYGITERIIPGEGDREEVPFGIPFETAHIGDTKGILYGEQSKGDVLPFLYRALQTHETNAASYRKTARLFREWTEETETRAKELDGSLLEWDAQKQYEAHAQLIIRIQDQDGRPVKGFDVFMHSVEQTGGFKLEKRIETKHVNRFHAGTITFYLRTKEFSEGEFVDCLADLADLNVQIFGTESKTRDVAYVPVSVRLTGDALRDFIHHHQTTIVDVQLLRVPTRNVFQAVEL